MYYVNPRVLPTTTLMYNDLTSVGTSIYRETIEVHNLAWSPKHKSMSPEPLRIFMSTDIVYLECITNVKTRQEF